MYTNPKTNTACSLKLVHEKTIILEKWKKYLKKEQTFRLETTLLPDVSNSIARVYTDQRMHTHALLFWFMQKNHWTILKQTYVEKPCRLETTLPPLFLVPIHDVLSLHFIRLQAKTKYWKNIGKISTYTEIILCSKPPPGFFWFLLMICYPCILFSFKHKRISENTGKYRNHKGKHTRNKTNP